MLLAGCGDPPAARCPTSAPVEVDLDAWHEAMNETAQPEASAAAAEQDRLLAALAMPPVSSEVRQEVPGRELHLGLSQLQLAPLASGSGGQPDWLVAAYFRGPSGAESLRAQILHPVSEREDIYCPLGDGLSHDQGAFEKPCLEPHAGPARQLAVEPLIAPQRDAIVARDAGGWCGPGASRGDRFATSWWGVEEGRLVRYLEVVTYEAWYESPAPPDQVRRGEIALSADWPRAITVAESVECLDDEEPAAGCRPYGRVTRYRYVDGSYAATGETPPPAAPTQADEETTP